MFLDTDTIVVIEYCWSETSAIEMTSAQLPNIGMMKMVVDRIG